MTGKELFDLGKDAERLLRELDKRKCVVINFDEARKRLRAGVKPPAASLQGESSDK